MKLMSLLRCLKTNNRILLSTRDGDFFPTVKELIDYREWNVECVQPQDKDLLLIGITDQRKQEDDEND